MGTPAIPFTCTHRPTIGGLVIPWVNVRLADGGVDFRAQHQAKTQRCFTETLCQVCATPITTTPIVFLGGPTQLAALQFDEPPLHPECATYVSHACPMVNGTTLQFATRTSLTSGHRGGTCPDDGCDCGGWIPTPGMPDRDTPQVHDWYAVYVSGYAVGVTPEHPNLARVAVVQPGQVLAVRHVSTPGVGRTWKRVPHP